MGFTLDKLNEIKEAVQEEKEQTETSSTVEELAKTRKQMEDLQAEVAMLNNTINSMLTSMDDNVTKLKNANTVEVTPEAKTYLDAQGKALGDKLIALLDDKGRKIIARMTYQSDRVQIPTSASYVLGLTLVMLLVQFVLLCFLNERIIHSDELERFCWAFGGMVVFSDAITVALFCWFRQHE
jgi:hypothetical protein